MFSPPASADSLSSESKWQQVSSAIQESSQYSGRPHQWFSFDGLDSSSDVQNFQPPFQTFGDRFNVS